MKKIIALFLLLQIIASAAIASPIPLAIQTMLVSIAQQHYDVDGLFVQNTRILASQELQNSNFLVVAMLILLDRNSKEYQIQARIRYDSMGTLLTMDSITFPRSSMGGNRLLTIL